MTMLKPELSPKEIVVLIKFLRAHIMWDHGHEFGERSKAIAHSWIYTCMECRGTMIPIQFTNQKLGCTSCGRIDLRSTDKIRRRLATGPNPTEAYYLQEEIVHITRKIAERDNLLNDTRIRNIKTSKYFKM